MNTKGTSCAGWNDCRQNQKEAQRATLSKIQRVRPAVKDDMAPDGGGGEGGGERGGGRGGAEAIYVVIIILVQRYS